MTWLVDKKTLELKKHVGAIHSSGKLTLVQRKIANALLYNAYDSLATQSEHKIHIRTLCDIIGYDSNDHKIIKNALMVLISTVVQWNLVDKDQNKSEEIWNASSIISDVRIKGAVCTYSYSNRMRELLYHPDLYGRLNMQVQAKFKSVYSLALYENCIRYQNINQTPWFNMPTFRSLMGISESKYNIFRDFKRRVLDVAIKEVNNYAPISIQVKYKKEGRAVTAIRFLIKHSQKILIDDNFEQEKHSKNSSNIENKLCLDFGFSKSNAEKVIKTYEEKFILDKIVMIESSSSFLSGKINNLAKYLELALKKDYQPPKSSKARVLESHKMKEKNKKLQDMMAKQLEEYDRYKNKEILNIYNEKISSFRKDEIDKIFHEYIKKTVYYEAYLKEGLSNILVSDEFCSFIKRIVKDNADFLSTGPSFEEFVLIKQES